MQTRRELIRRTIFGATYLALAPVAAITKADVIVDPLRSIHRIFRISLCATEDAPDNMPLYFSLCRNIVSRDTSLMNVVFSKRSHYEWMAPPGMEVIARPDEQLVWTPDEHVVARMLSMDEDGRLWSNFETPYTSLTIIPRNGSLLT